MKYIASLIILALSFCIACENTQNNVVPSVPVNINLSLDDPAYNSLNVVGGTAYFDAGIRGIIIYRKGTSEFNAFDRACTYHVNDTCGYVSIDSTSSINVGCKCCGSRFQLVDGTVSRGPATVSLRMYNTLLEGRTLRIYN